MGRCVFVWLMLAEILMVQAMADGSELNPLNVMVRTGVDLHKVVVRISDPPVSSTAESSTEGEEESKGAEAPEIRRLGKHHSSDKSVAGGGVIIGGLATAIFAAVVCYIRVTRRRTGDH